MGRVFSWAQLLAVAAVAAGVAARGGQGNDHSNGHGGHGSSTTADYVIIGAGPAGVVLAEQLSRDGTKSVVLIEAGPDSIHNVTVDSKSIANLLDCEQNLLTYCSSGHVPLYHGTILELHSTAR